MSQGLARVWPNGQALEQALSQSAMLAPGGLLLGGGGHYTFQGKNALLPLLWSQLPPQSRRSQPLAELAGPVLVQKLLESLGQEQAVLGGISRGRRFPHRLWRLLVGLKAARLGPEEVTGLPGHGASRRKALAGLLAAYTAELTQRSLADEADQLAAVEAHLLGGGAFPLLQTWDALEVREALWLRPAELRLLFALSRLVPVRMSFALTPPVGAGQEVFHLLESTARALEAHGGNLEVEWADLEQEGGPLASLALGAWEGEEASPASGQSLELLRAPGRYAEVEALVARARHLVDSGVPPHELLMVFPELGLYGQMAVDVAARLGLPLSFRRSEPLAGTPLAQAFLELLSLPQMGYSRVELSRVWDSPYLGQALARHLQVPLPHDAARLLAQAFYVDARETPVREWLNNAAKRVEGSKALAWQELAQDCGALTAWLAPLDQAQSLAEYCARVQRLLQGLEPSSELMTGLGSGRWPALALARDLGAWEGLRRAVSGLEQAAGQVGANHANSPGRNLALLKQALEQQDAGPGVGARGGVRVLRLEDAQGLRPAYVLAGGLNMEEFPARPSDLRLLDNQERLALGRKAGLSVWRTEEEEYGGQVLRLLLLLGSAQKGAVLSCCAADLDGSPRSPSLLLEQIARRLGREDELKAPAGSVFGETPAVAKCRDRRSLWSALVRDLLRPRLAAAPQDGLAQAALHALARDPAVADSWRSLAARARVEEHRLRLEAMPPEDRQARGGAYDGLLQEGAAREFLAELLAEPSCRKFSPTTLETYVACPMRWFLARMLGLSEPREPGWDLERSEEGSWVHETLARFFAPSEFDPTWDQAAQTERLGRCLNQAREDLAGQGRAGHGQVQESRHQVLARTLGQVVAREMADMAALRPSRVEAEFGKDDPGLRVDMEQGDPLFLHGRLDRLDQAPGMLRVVDYKHVSQPGKVTGPLKKEDLGVSAFQMPVYLAAARELWGKADDAMSARVAPTRKIEQKPLQGEFQPGDPFLAVDTATRRELAAVGQPNLFNGIADLWSRLQDGNFMPLPQKKACEYCPMSGVCRARVSPAAALEGEQS
ncbi:MAG: PD-(D/E)XK nuclease family protein [Proteobacteria bacterium]|nr:PD-(D/E)XK nuclease family protein [Pseudomonadota bacterium]MBU1451876.1 PD-(D/E)XK nuclease family protein [Pseudomonadota bacterium]